MASLAKIKQINRELSKAGLAGCVDYDAVERIANFVHEQERGDVLQELLRICQSERPSSGNLGRSHVEAAIAQLQGNGASVELIAVINAFDVPKISYDPVGRKMFADPTPRSLFAGAQAKHAVYIDRLQLISQRLRRNRSFQQNYQLLSSNCEGSSGQLTDLQSLRGVVGASRIVMGCISRAEDGRRLMLEDTSGSVPLDISQAETTAGFFTENCIVIAQGELHADGVFHVTALGFPPTEAREDLPMASQRLNFFGGPSLSPDEMNLVLVEESSGAHDQDRVVVAADVWLDKRETLAALGTLLAGFQEVAIVPPVIVLMGNFHSKSAAGAADFQELKDGFAALARLIDQFPRIKASTRFVFVPGPGDPGPAAVLPQPPLTPYFTADIMACMPNAVFASNPCRLRYFSKQLVLFRYDVLKHMRRRCLLPPQGGEAASCEAMWGQLALTVLQQSHLCPLPLVQQPVYWQFDHALHLYPVPDALLLADSSPQAQHSHGGCMVFNPGSFSEGCFAAYVPVQQLVEMSALPRDGDAGDTQPDTDAGDQPDVSRDQELGGQRAALDVETTPAAATRAARGRKKAVWAGFVKKAEGPGAADAAAAPMPGIAEAGGEEEMADYADDDLDPIDNGDVEQEHLEEEDDDAAGADDDEAGMRLEKDQDYYNALVLGFNAPRRVEQETAQLAAGSDAGPSRSAGHRRRGREWEGAIEEEADQGVAGTSSAQGHEVEGEAEEAQQGTDAGPLLQRCGSNSDDEGGGDDREGGEGEEDVEVVDGVLTGRVRDDYLDDEDDDA